MVWLKVQHIYNLTMWQTVTAACETGKDDLTTCEERKELSASPLNTQGQRNGGQLLDAV